MNAAASTLADRIDAALPQTQCTRCGEPDCRAYAEAIANGLAPINRCPPGGAEGIQRLALITRQPVLPLDPAHGTEGPRVLAVIDEATCIGCTLCIQACPVDCIVGAPQRMHTVIDNHCTGCELCVPACPVDCIALVPVTAGTSGWDAWSADEARAARAAYQSTRQRRARREQEQAQRLAAATRARRATPAP
jgi:Na+-translocating ferredoxin:NAD+ oxidoreductase subunit B